MRLNLTRIGLVLVFLLGGLHAASAFYDPGLQRWVNRDPMEEYGGINLYSFVFNDPMDWNDPYGESCGALSLVTTTTGEALGIGAASTALAAPIAIGTIYTLVNDLPYGTVMPPEGLSTVNAPPTTITIEMSHRKPRPSTHDKHTKPRSGGPEKKDDRMQPPPPPRGPKQPKPPKPPEYIKGPKQKNGCSDDNSS